MDRTEIPFPAPLEGWVARLWREQRDSDGIVHAHSIRVGQIAGVVAAHLGIEAVDVLKIQLASQFHDIGKLDLPREVLYAPRRLTEEEMAIIRQHSALGALRLRKLEAAPVLALVEDVTLHHHERYDGSGYPDRLIGNAASLAARIAAAADVYAALWERRAYKTAISHDEVLARMTTGDDRMRPAFFDPEVLVALRDTQRTIRRLVVD
ncbi:MAG: HD domain-containing protein [Telmatospirillum sp.]|nr:HD domain-containing protein [Telmatospirillum sp.]